MQPQGQAAEGQPDEPSSSPAVDPAQAQHEAAPSRRTSTTIQYFVLHARRHDCTQQAHAQAAAPRAGSSAAGVASVEGRPAYAALIRGSGSTTGATCAFHQPPVLRDSLSRLVAPRSSVWSAAPREATERVAAFILG